MFKGKYESKLELPEKRGGSFKPKKPPWERYGYFFFCSDTFPINWNGAWNSQHPIIQSNLIFTVILKWLNSFDKIYVSSGGQNFFAILWIYFKVCYHMYYYRASVWLKVDRYCWSTPSINILIHPDPDCCLVDTMWTLKFDQLSVDSRLSIEN